jgi:hypothetical protein
LSSPAAGSTAALLRAATGWAAVVATICAGAPCCAPSKSDTRFARSGRWYSRASVATAEKPKTVIVCFAVVHTPRAVLTTENHVMGWLAAWWTSFALEPMKRWIIVPPLSRKKNARRGAERTA